MNPSKLAIVTLVLARSLVASAEPAPAFEVLDRGDAVEIVAHGMKATRTAIAPIRTRLEIPIAGSPAAPRMFAKDATVKQIELDGGPAQRVVSIKLGFEHPEVVQLARFAQAIQVGDDLHVLVPRKLPGDGQVAHLPEPTMPVVVPLPAAAPIVGPVKPVEVTPPAVAKVEPAKPDAAPTVGKVEAKVDAKPEVKPEAKPEPKLEAKPEPKVEAKPEAKPEPKKPITAAAPALARTDDERSPMSLLIGGAVVLLGATLWFARKKQKKTADAPSIDVVAQRSLGGKAKIVWLTAAGRDLVVAVTPQQVRMLHQAATRRPNIPRSVGAKGTDRHPLAALGAIGPEPEVDADGAAWQPNLGDIAISRTQSSPAISGLLKLRERHEDVPSLRPARLGSPSPVSDDVATDDYAADELWAREIRAATANHGRGR